MIRKLTYLDKQKYIDHLNRVYDKKGKHLSTPDMSILQQRQQELDNTYIDTLFLENIVLNGKVTKHIYHLFACLDDKGQIVQTFKTFYNHYFHTVTILSYTSEKQGLFKPKKDLLPLLNEVMCYFEHQEVFSFYLVRKLGFFEWRRNIFFEDVLPLNRYNCYFESIIPSNTQSDHQGFRELAQNLTFSQDTGVVRLSLKQEYRTYHGRKIIPDTEKMYQNTIKQDICIIGFNPNTLKIGNYLNEVYSKTNNVKTIGRNNFDFSSLNWKLALQYEINSFSKSPIIIVNIFDYNVPELQQEVFDFIWKTYKHNHKVHIIVIGSIAHYVQKDLISKEYFTAKKALYKKSFECALTDHYNCKLLLIEPGVVESYIINSKPNWPSYFITDTELAEKILNLINLNDKFMSVSLVGCHSYTPN